MAFPYLLPLAVLFTSVSGSTYSNSSSSWSSPVVYPAPNITGAGGWEDALAKAEAFVAELTLDEKAYIATGVTGPCVGAIKPISRLGFSGLCLQDGPLALRKADYVSAFPAGLSVAASWDVDLAYQRAVYMGDEFRDKGAHVILGPVAGPLGRNALGGRNWEGFSPDPYLTGLMYATTVEGVQSVGVQACGKHYIGNEQETQRNPSTSDDGTTIYSVSSNIDDRTMHELYLWPFAEGVKSGIASIMCSYNRVNETYSCENSKILNGLLKEELGFQGYVMSDWGGTHSGLPAILAGLDMDMPGSLTMSGGTASYFGGNLTTAVQNGSLPISRLNDLVKRVITPWYFLGQDSGFPSIDPSSAEINDFDASTSEYNFTITEPSHRDVRGGHSTLIRSLGASSAVLLKNDGALPLEQPMSVGVFGNDAPDLTGGTDEPFYSTTGPNIGTLYVGGGSGTGRATYLTSPLRAIQTRTEEYGALLQYVTDNSEIDSSFSHIYPVPDVCLVFLKTYVTEGDDRTSYSVDDDGNTVVTNVASNCNNTIVITHSGGINLMPWADNENVTAIIAANLPGNEIGNSIVDVLWGDVNPSGKLPYTIAYNESDYNTAVANVSGTATDPEAYQSDFTEGLFIDYRHFDSKNITPRFEFGYGLSYTTFTLADLEVAVATSSDISAYPTSATTVPGGNPNLYEVLATANVTLSNTGSLAGATVPQLYLYAPSSAPSDTPVKVLRGFKKLTLSVAESAQVGFSLTRKDLSYWDVVAQDWKLFEGELTIGVGFSSRDIRLTGTVMLY